MKIFVTGSTGVVGRRLVPLLRYAGHDVTAVARSAAGRERLARLGARPIDLDLFDARAIGHAVTDHDALVNLATHIPHSTAQMFLPSTWRENDRLRREASAALAAGCLAAGVPRFVQESFAPVYPDCGDRWIDETVPIKPVRYNRTVADAEASAEGFTESGRVGIVLRFGAFYGADAFQTVDFIKWVRKGWAPMPGPTTSYISSVSHDDAANAAAAALALPPGVYNVVDDEPLTHQVFFDSLASALGVAPPRFPPAWLTPLFGSLAEMAARSLRISNQKLRAACGWIPNHRSVREAWPSLVAEVRAAQPGRARSDSRSGALSR